MHNLRVSALVFQNGCTAFAQQNWGTATRVLREVTKKSDRVSGPLLRVLRRCLEAIAEWCWVGLRRDDACALRGSNSVIQSYPIWTNRYRWSECCRSHLNPKCPMSLRRNCLIVQILVDHSRSSSGWRSGPSLKESIDSNWRHSIREFARCRLWIPYWWSTPLRMPQTSGQSRLVSSLCISCAKWHFDRRWDEGCNCWVCQFEKIAHAMSTGRANSTICEAIFE